MKDLHKTLRHTLAFYIINKDQLEQAIGDIEGVFAKAGFVKATIQNDLHELIIAKTEEARITIERKKVLGDVMTGQEWYDRFIQALDHQYRCAAMHPADRKQVDIAARRASGISEDV